jgi:crossover junction endodeoxyribonuclease RuvC
MSAASPWSSPECAISGTERPTGLANASDSATPPARRRILGIDPGLRVTGFGVIDALPGGRLVYVSSGVIRVPEGDLASRLAVIFTQVQAVIAQTSPDASAIEKVFVNVNPASTLLLGQARGAALCALATSGLPVAEYTALQLKQAIVGYGRASKEQMQAMVTRLLALPGEPSKDAADALACAICHAHAQGQQSRRGRLQVS